MEALKVLDTDVFIDHFRGTATATAYIQGLPVGQRATTDVTIIELYKGATNREQLATIERFLTRNHVTRLCLAAAISQRAVTLLHTYVLAQGLSIPDALIAALVLEGDHTLVTSNVRHCQVIPGLRLEPAPYRLREIDHDPQR